MLVWEKRKVSNALNRKEYGMNLSSKRAKQKLYNQANKGEHRGSGSNG